MLSSKLKSWVESHLTRSGKKSKSGSKQKQKSLLLPEDRIALTPLPSSLAVPHLSSTGRSNAALVIQLQNDIASNASWGKNSHLVNSPVIAWRHPNPSPIILQNLDQSPSSISNSTSKSFSTRGSGGGGEGGGGCNGGGGEGSISSKATSSSICADFRVASSSSEGHDSGLPADFTRSHLPSLSSPESAYSTGCSADISPSQDGFDASCSAGGGGGGGEAIWRHSVDDSVCTQSPRTRPAIRTNPWISARASLTLTEKPSWPADNSLLGLSSPSSSSSASVDPPSERSKAVARETDEASGLHPPPARESMNHLCDSLELLMDGDQLRAITHHVDDVYRAGSGIRSHPAGISSGPEAKRWEIDIDEQYTQLIRETEEILTQLENDEFILFGRKPEDEEMLAKVAAPAPPPLLASAHRKKARKTAAMRRSSREFETITSSESEMDYRDSLAGRKADWRRLKSANRNRVMDNRSAAAEHHTPNPPRFTPQNEWVHPHPPPQQRDCWINNNPPSCWPPDDWHRADEEDSDDGPPSPAPMDPQCHWSSTSAAIRTTEPINHPDYIDPVWPEKRHPHWRPPATTIETSFSPPPPSAAAQRFRHQRGRIPSSCPDSPGVYWKDGLDSGLMDDHLYLHGPAASRPADVDPVGHQCDNRWSCAGDDAQLGQSPRSSTSSSRQWRHTWREQQRLESQIAFLRQQLMKNVTDYYGDDDDDDVGPYDRPLSSSSSTGSSRCPSPSFSVHRPERSFDGGHLYHYQQKSFDFRPV